MMDGVIPSEEFNTQLIRAVKHVLRAERSGVATNNRHMPRAQEIRACILDGALAVATDAKTGAATATATFCDWDEAASDFVESTFTDTVWNHSESQSYATDTFGFALKVGGRWRFSGDCDPMGAR